MAILGIFGIPSGLFTVDVGKWFVAFFIISSCLSLLTVPHLLCPNCQQICHSKIDKFCCACRANDMDRSKIDSWTKEIKPRCRKCLVELGHEAKTSYPEFRIRYCTHCGELLDPKGTYPRKFLGMGYFRIKWGHNRVTKNDRWISIVLSPHTTRSSRSAMGGSEIIDNN